MRLFIAVLLAMLATQACRAQFVIINEFMAVNDRTLKDEDGASSDWIELLNASTTSVNLAGWRLTDNASRLDKWVLPGTNLPAGGFLLVFASDKNRSQPGQPLHTNFKLSSEGEYLALVRPDGAIASQYAPVYPPQYADVSYGVYGGAQTDVLVQSNALCRVYVPSNGVLGLAWISNTFNDSSWISGPLGAGYDTTATPVDYSPFIGVDVRSQMYQKLSSCYIRVPFIATNVAGYTQLIYRKRYEDGYVAYLNGRELLRANAPATALWNSTAPTWRNDDYATVYEDTTIALSGQLVEGTNVLAIHGLNQSISSGDLLMQPEMHARRVGAPQTNDLRYFTAPTPGAPNADGIRLLGPAIAGAGHTPDPLLPADTLTITAQIAHTINPVAQVLCTYRVMYLSEVTVPMYDDGAHSDGAAGDGVYAAAVPASVASPGQMIRYYIRAIDNAGATSRWPMFLAPEKEEYLGTIVHDAALSTNIPVYHWFVQSPAAADTWAGTRCSLFYDGEFYDNLYVRIKGHSSAGQTKKPHTIEFHSEHKFRLARELPRVDEVNLNSLYNDQSYLREWLAWETLRQAGAPYAYNYHVHLRQNALFNGLVLAVEQLDGDFLRRLDIPDSGRLYKCGDNQLWLRELTNYSTMTTYQLKRPDDGNYAPLVQLINAMIGGSSAKQIYAFDYIDIPSVVNYLAAHLLIQDMDFAHKNYYMYFDTYGKQEWNIFAWDKDLTYGHRWGATNCVANDDGDGRGVSSPYNGNYNTLYGMIYNVNIPWMDYGIFRDMYARRARTIMDEQLQPPGTPPSELRIEAQIYAMRALLKPFADADRDKWGFPAPGGYFNYPHYYIDEGCHELTNEYFAPRRQHLYVTHNISNPGKIIPNAQPDDPLLSFGTIEVIPASYNPDQQYIELRNELNYAVDISGWRLSNAIEHVFAPGTVLPSNTTLYVSPNVSAFRARTASPKGGQRRFAQGNYRGRLSAHGGRIDLLNRQGVIVRSRIIAPSLSGPQQHLRVSEIMYHPADPPPGSPFENSDFEWIELFNCSDQPLVATGVQFCAGITFVFPPSNYVIAPRGCVVLVNNIAAFATRYVTNDIAIAGTYAGKLDNAGERLETADWRNQTIQSFSYSPDWYPQTDGQGYSLVIADPDGVLTNWETKAGWLPSEILHGSPGTFVPEAGTGVVLLVALILAHRRPV